MEKSIQELRTLESQLKAKPFNSKQDYAHWVITGRRFYCTNLDWHDVNNEAEEVLSVNGELCVCEDCGKTGPGLKLTCNTPSFHNSNFSICLSCTKAAYEKDGGKVVSELLILEEYWQAISEGSLAGDIMNTAEVYPDNLGVDEDGVAYEFEAGDPVTWDQFSLVSQQKIIQSQGGMEGVFEKLHDEEYHTFCKQQNGEHVWDGDQVAF